MFTDLYDIFATDDLNFILHSVKITEEKKSITCLSMLAATFSTVHSSYPSEKKGSEASLYSPQIDTNEKKGSKSTKKKKEKNTNLELFFTFLLGLLE